MKRQRRRRGPNAIDCTCICEWCGERFETTRDDTLTCGARCRNRRSAYYRRLGYYPDAIPGPVTTGTAVAAELRRLVAAESARRAQLRAELMYGASSAPAQNRHLTF